MLHLSFLIANCELRIANWYHDCKDYIASYQDLHYRYQMETAVNIGFWWDTPVERRARQQLELSLIVKWRSPFNKEN